MTPRPTLIAALVRCAKIAVRDERYPARACVRVAASDDTLTLSAQDGALWLTVYVPVVGDIAPRLVNTRALLDVVRCVTGDVTLTATGTDTKPTLTVEADGSTFVLVAHRHDVPDAPESIATGLHIDAVALPRMLAQVVYNIAPDDNRYGLNGLAVEMNPDAVRFVATDGNRLSYAEGPGLVSCPVTPIPRHLLPSKAARVLALLGGGVSLGFRVLPDEPPKREGDKPYPGRGYFEARGNGWTLAGNLIIADFPDYRQVLPSTHKREVIVDRAALVKAMRRMAPVAGKRRSGDTRWALRPGGIDVSATYDDLGTARATVPAGFTGDDLTVGLNYRFVVDALAPLPDGPVRLLFGDTLSPMIVTSLVDGSSLHVVMPVRLD